MQRFDRARFVAFGVLPVANALALLWYGLGLSTGVSGGSGNSIPLLLVMVAVFLLCAMIAAVKRGHDLGLGTGITVLAFWVALSLGPLLLLLVGYLAWARHKPETADRYGPTPDPATAVTWTWALLNLVWPWFLLAAAARLW